MNFLEAHNIYKSYHGHDALIDVTINVPRGSIFGLLGPNGAGKTSLIRIINQITNADSGNLFFKGRKIDQNDVYNIGYLPEERGLYKKMKAGEQAVYLAQLKGLDKQTAVKRLKYWFEKFGIMQWWNKRIDQLSKGMAQKVQFIVTIIHEPELLVFDEPFSGFDPINTNLIKQEIINLKNNGSTVIFSTHNMSSVEEICEDIALINESKLVLSGKVQDIKEFYSKNHYRIEFAKTDVILREVLPEKFNIIEQSVKIEKEFATIELPEGVAQNELINILTSKMKIRLFKEILPTVNDIFIDRVLETKTKV